MPDKEMTIDIKVNDEFQPVLDETNANLQKVAHELERIYNKLESSLDKAFKFEQR